MSAQARRSDFCHHGVELAQVTEGEAPQERAERRRRHHPMSQDLIAGPGAQHVGVVDVAGPGHHGVYQGEHLASGLEATPFGGDVHQGVDEGLEPEPLHHCGHQQQPGVGDQIVLVEGHRDPVDPARYWLHWKCLLCG